MEGKEGKGGKEVGGRYGPLLGGHSMHLRTTMSTVEVTA